MRRTIGVGSIGVGGIAGACRQAPLWFPEANVEARPEFCADSVAPLAVAAVERSMARSLGGSGGVGGERAGRLVEDRCV